MEGEALHHVTGPGLKEVFALINLLVVGAIIYFGGRKAIMAMIKDRADLISKKLVEAKTELERIKFETERARREIQDIGQTKEKLIAEVREEGLKLYENIVKEARAAAARILEDAKLAADNETRLAAEQLKKSLVKRAMNETIKVTSESNQDVRKKIHDRLVENLGEFTNGVL